MSCLCYSIFKIEPYPDCAFNCLYCYVRMFPRRIARRAVIDTYISQLKRVIIEFKRVFGMVPAFRMATLVDPFQEKERFFRHSYKAMEYCLNLGCPLIINTKGTLALEEPWIDIIRQLGKRSLLVYQPTVTLLDEDAKLVELQAPLSSERLEVAKELSRLGIPVVIRLQPLIPYINTETEYMEELLAEFKATGARQVIAEFLRFNKANLLLRFKPLFRKHRIPFWQFIRRSLWETIPRSSHKRPKMKYREQIMLQLKEIATSKGLKFSTCREGFYHLHTAPNCCGLHYLGRYLVRPTLLEYLHLDRYFRLLADKNKVVMSEGRIEMLRYGLRRALKKHEEMIKKVIKDQSLLLSIAPSSALGRSLRLEI